MAIPLAFARDVSQQSANDEDVFWLLVRISSVRQDVFHAPYAHKLVILRFLRAAPIASPPSKPASPPPHLIIPSFWLMLSRFASRLCKTAGRVSGAHVYVVGGAGAVPQGVRQERLPHQAMGPLHYPCWPLPDSDLMYLIDLVRPNGGEG